jgi:uncharacterized membrane protein HdeD (DUF308 family)
MDENYYHQRWWSFVLRGLVALIFGIVAIIYPAYVFAFLIYFFAVFAIIISALMLVAGAAAGGGERWPVIGLSIIGILIGIFALFAPVYFAILIIYLIAFWALITGIGDLVAAFSGVGSGWGRLLLGLLGIVSLIFGILLLFYPLLGGATLVFVLGIYAIVFGILGIIFGFSVRGSMPAQTGTI